MLPGKRDSSQPRSLYSKGENLGTRLDSSKSVHGMRDIFPSLSGIWEIMTTQIHVLAANAIHQGERSVVSLIS